MAERALELMLTRVTHRIAFGLPLAEQGSIKEDIANARVEINQVRLLCLDTAYKMDKQGNKNTKKEIALCKIAAPRMAKQVIDNAMQAFGGTISIDHEHSSQTNQFLHTFFLPGFSLELQYLVLSYFLLLTVL